eukprot:1645967-Alexandrium_andersonii.AAC.1
MFTAPPLRTRTNGLHAHVGRRPGLSAQCLGIAEADIFHRCWVEAVAVSEGGGLPMPRAGQRCQHRCRATVGKQSTND